MHINEVVLNKWFNKGIHYVHENVDRFYLIVQINVWMILINNAICFPLRERA